MQREFFCLRGLQLRVLQGLMGSSHPSFQIYSTCLYYFHQSPPLFIFRVLLLIPPSGIRGSNQNLPEQPHLWVNCRHFGQLRRSCQVRAVGGTKDPWFENWLQMQVQHLSSGLYKMNKFLQTPFFPRPNFGQLDLLINLLITSSSKNFHLIVMCVTPAICTRPYAVKATKKIIS